MMRALNRAVGVVFGALLWTAAVYAIIGVALSGLWLLSPLW
jgi:hypothetical protein